MKVFQYLTIDLNDKAKEEIIAKIDSFLTKDWVRNKNIENAIKKIVTHEDEEQFCYTPKSKNLENANLWLAKKGSEHCLYVSNIVPNEKGQLTRDEYNSIITSFYEMLSNTDITCELTPPDISGREILSEEAYNKLEVFSHCANKSTAYYHPYDRDRWLDFVIVFYKSKSKRDFEIIERILIEEMNWSEETASKLSSQLSYSVDVLEYFKNECI